MAEGEGGRTFSFSVPTTAPEQVRNLSGRGCFECIDYIPVFENSNPALHFYDDSSVSSSLPSSSRESFSGASEYEEGAPSCRGSYKNRELIAILELCWREADRKYEGRSNTEYEMHERGVEEHISALLTMCRNKHNAILGAIRRHQRRVLLKHSFEQIKSRFSQVRWKRLHSFFFVDRISRLCSNSLAEGHVGMRSRAGE